MTSEGWQFWTEEQKLAHVDLSRAQAQALKCWSGSITSTAYGDYLTAVMECTTSEAVEDLVERLAGR
jgi:hypothetical protein